LSPLGGFSTIGPAVHVATPTPTGNLPPKASVPVSMLAPVRYIGFRPIRLAVCFDLSALIESDSGLRVLGH
jgi:hypothetical protein